MARCADGLDLDGTAPPVLEVFLLRADESVDRAEKIIERAFDVPVGGDGRICQQVSILLALRASWASIGSLRSRVSAELVFAVTGISIWPLGEGVRQDVITL